MPRSMSKSEILFKPQQVTVKYWGLTEQNLPLFFGQQVGALGWLFGLKRKVIDICVCVCVCVVVSYSNTSIFYNSH